MSAGKFTHSALPAELTSQILIPELVMSFPIITRVPSGENATPVMFEASRGGERDRLHRTGLLDPPDLRSAVFSAGDQHGA